MRSKIHLHLNSFWMPYDLVRLSSNLGQFELTLREHIIGGCRDLLDMLTPHEAHHSSRIMRTHITHILVYLWGILLDGGMTEKEIKSLCCLALYLCLDIPSNLSRALSCLRLSGHNFLVQIMRHDRNRRPCELRIGDRCDWHTIQDEEHILLDCTHEHSSGQTSHTATAYLPTSV